MEIAYNYKFFSSSATPKKFVFPLIFLSRSAIASHYIYKHTNISLESLTGPPLSTAA